MMKLPRRRFLHLAAGAAALPAFSRIAKAETYPSRPVRWIVGFPPGGGADIIARLLADWLSARLGQPFIIENRSGGGTNIATEAVVRAPADGYTLGFIATPNTINATLSEKLNFDFQRDIAPVASLSLLPNIMEVNPSVPAKTVPEFIAYAKANPGKLSFGSAGVGTPLHLAGELFKMMAGVDMVHVPYRGSVAAIPDLINGRIQVMFDVLPPSIEHIRAGSLRLLATATAKRLETFPDIPTVSEFLPGYEASTWNGVGVPEGTPTEIIKKLNAVINAGLTDPKITARLKDLGGVPTAMSPSDLSAFIAEDIEKWAKAIKFAGLKPS
jgi:tripartite-type tricarboxylate transporter receptor subunit TctC